jgi:hypothetical protein
MPTKHRRSRNIRKNNKSRSLSRSKRGGAGHSDDTNLRLAERYVFRYTGSESEGPEISIHLKEYLRVNQDKEGDYYKKVKQINDMLIEGFNMMTEGYKQFESFMDDDKE